MSKEDALRFLEQARTDQELVEKVRAAIVDGSAASFACAASDLGFAFTEEELAEASAELRQADADKLDGMEIDDEELDQVAGGREQCHDTYRWGENCLASDQCDRVYHYYKDGDACDYTYYVLENCFFLDRKWGGVKV